MSCLDEEQEFIRKLQENKNPTETLQAPDHKELHINEIQFHDALFRPSSVKGKRFIICSVVSNADMEVLCINWSSVTHLAY